MSRVSDSVEYAARSSAPRGHEARRAAEKAEVRRDYAVKAFEKLRLKRDEMCDAAWEALRQRDEARREAERMRRRFLSVVPVDDPAYLDLPWEREGGDDG